MDPSTPLRHHGLWQASIRCDVVSFRPKQARPWLRLRDLVFVNDFSQPPHPPPFPPIDPDSKGIS
eukprot:scaffold86_cov338-Pavlova_lutheri.AAC.95